MRQVDGSAGGGQLVRSALTLSMLTGEPVRIDDVRADRSTPGLAAQHLAVVETAASICDADVEGDEGGAETVTFDPGPLAGGSYEASIGTAGSLSLLFDAVLPLADRIDEPLTVTATGGTDVAWSPPAAYYRQVKLPLLRSFGLGAAVDVERTGFYPAGGGRATLRLWPSDLSSIDLADPGPVTGARVYSKASADLSDADVAERQADAAVDRLQAAGVETTARTVRSVDSDSTGSAVVVRVDRERSRAGFDAFGEPGLPAEDVAANAVDGVRSFVESGAAVDAHLADQLLVFLALAGGRVAVPRLTGHVESSRDLLATFGCDVAAERAAGSTVLAADPLGKSSR